VVAGEAPAQVAVTKGLARRLDAAESEILDEDVRRLEHQPAHARGARRPRG
jgi:hypothetical protein